MLVVEELSSVDPAVAVLADGAEAGLYILFATVDPDAGYKGIPAFVIDREADGFTVGKKEDNPLRRGEALLLPSRHDLSIAQEDGGAVVVERGDAEEVVGERPIAAREVGESWR